VVKQAALIRITCEIDLKTEPTDFIASSIAIAVLRTFRQILAKT